MYIYLHATLDGSSEIIRSCHNYPWPTDILVPSFFDVLVSSFIQPSVLVCFSWFTCFLMHIIQCNGNTQSSRQSNSQITPSRGYLLLLEKRILGLVQLVAQLLHWESACLFFSILVFNYRSLLAGSFLSEILGNRSTGATDHTAPPTAQ